MISIIVLNTKYFDLPESESETFSIVHQDFWNKINQDFSDPTINLSNYTIRGMDSYDYKKCSSMVLPDQKNTRLILGKGRINRGKDRFLYVTVRINNKPYMMIVGSIAHHDYQKHALTDRDTKDAALKTLAEIVLQKITEIEQTLPITESTTPLPATVPRSRGNAIICNEDQGKARSYITTTEQEVLLIGPAGSGKTLVFAEAFETLLNAQKGVVYLVPTQHLKALVKTTLENKDFSFEEMDIIPEEVILTLKDFLNRVISTIFEEAQQDFISTINDSEIKIVFRKFMNQGERPLTPALECADFCETWWKDIQKTLKKKGNLSMLPNLKYTGKKIKEVIAALTNLTSEDLFTCFLRLMESDCVAEGYFFSKKECEDLNFRLDPELVFELFKEYLKALEQKNHLYEPRLFAKAIAKLLNTNRDQIEPYLKVLMEDMEHLFIDEIQSFHSAFLELALSLSKIQYAAGDPNQGRGKKALIATYQEKRARLGLKEAARFKFEHTFRCPINHTEFSNVVLNSARKVFGSISDFEERLSKSGKDMGSLSYKTTDQFLQEKIPSGLILFIIPEEMREEQVPKEIRENRNFLILKALSAVGLENQTVVMYGFGDQYRVLFEGLDKALDGKYPSGHEEVLSAARPKNKDKEPDFDKERNAVHEIIIASSRAFHELVVVDNQLHCFFNGCLASVTQGKVETTETQDPFDVWKNLIKPLLLKEDQKERNKGKDALFTSPIWGSDTNATKAKLLFDFAKTSTDELMPLLEKIIREISDKFNAVALKNFPKEVVKILEAEKRRQDENRMPITMSNDSQVSHSPQDKGKNKRIKYVPLSPELYDLEEEEDDSIRTNTKISKTPAPTGKQSKIQTIKTKANTPTTPQSLITQEEIDAKIEEKETLLQKIHNQDRFTYEEFCSAIKLVFSINCLEEIPKEHKFTDLEWQSIPWTFLITHKDHLEKIVENEPKNSLLYNSAIDICTHIVKNCQDKKDFFLSLCTTNRQFIKIICELNLLGLSDLIDFYLTHISTEEKGKKAEKRLLVFKIFLDEFSKSEPVPVNGTTFSSVNEYQVKIHCLLEKYLETLFKNSLQYFDDLYDFKEFINTLFQNNFKILLQAEKTLLFKIIETITSRSDEKMFVYLGCFLECVALQQCLKNPSKAELNKLDQETIDYYQAMYALYTYNTKDLERFLLLQLKNLFIYSPHFILQFFINTNEKNKNLIVVNEIFNVLSKGTDEMLEKYCMALCQPQTQPLFCAMIEWAEKNKTKEGLNNPHGKNLLLKLLTLKNREKLTGFHLMASYSKEACLRFLQWSLRDQEAKNVLLKEMMVSTPKNETFFDLIYSSDLYSPEDLAQLEDSFKNEPQLANSFKEARQRYFEIQEKKKFLQEIENEEFTYGGFCDAIGKLMSYQTKPHLKLLVSDWNVIPLTFLTRHVNHLDHIAKNESQGSELYKNTTALIGFIISFCQDKEDYFLSTPHLLIQSFVKTLCLFNERVVYRTLISFLQNLSNSTEKECSEKNERRTAILKILFRGFLETKLVDKKQSYEVTDCRTLADNLVEQHFDLVKKYFANFNQSETFFETLFKKTIQNIFWSDFYDFTTFINYFAETKIKIILQPQILYQIIAAIDTSTVPTLKMQYLAAFLEYIALHEELFAPNNEVFAKYKLSQETIEYYRAIYSLKALYDNPEKLLEIETKQFFNIFCYSPRFLLNFFIESEKKHILPTIGKQIIHLLESLDSYSEQNFVNACAQFPHLFCEIIRFAQYNADVKDALISYILNSSSIMGLVMKFCEEYGFVEEKPAFNILATKKLYLWIEDTKIYYACITPLGKKILKQLLLDEDTTISKKHEQQISNAGVFSDFSLIPLNIVRSIVRKRGHIDLYNVQHELLIWARENETVKKMLFASYGFDQKTKSLVNFQLIALKAPQVIHEFVKLAFSDNTVRDILLKLLSFTDQNGLNALHFMSMSSEEACLQLVNLAMKVEVVKSRLIRILNAANNSKLTCLHFIAQFSPDAYSALLTWVIQDEDVKAALINTFFLISDDGWTTIQILAKHSPEAFLNLIELAMRDDVIKRKLLEALNLEIPKIWNLFQIVARYSPKACLKLVEFATTNDAIKINLLKVLPLLALQGWTSLHLMASHSPEAYSALLNWAMTDETIREKVIQVLKMNISNIRGLDWLSFNSPEACLTLVEFAARNDELMTALLEILTHPIDNLPSFYLLANNALKACFVLIELATTNPEIKNYLLKALDQETNLHDVKKIAWDVKSAYLKFLLIPEKPGLKQKLIKSLFDYYTDSNVTYPILRYITNQCPEICIKLMELAVSDMEIKNALMKALLLKDTNKNKTTCFGYLTREGSKLSLKFIELFGKDLEIRQDFLKMLNDSCALQSTGFHIIFENAPEACLKFMEILSTDEELQTALIKVLPQRNNCCNETVFDIFFTKGKYTEKDIDTLEALFETNATLKEEFSKTKQQHAGQSKFKAAKIYEVTNNSSEQNNPDEKDSKKSAPSTVTSFWAPTGIQSQTTQPVGSSSDLQMASS